MEAHSDWYNRTVKEIGSYKDTLSAKDYKKYKLDLLLRIARRVEDFSSICGQCQLFQQEITGLTKEPSLLIQIPNKENSKSYFKVINNIVKHLQKQHKLVREGQNKGKWIGVSLGIGTALGAVLGNAGIGVAIGVAIGIAIGSYMDKKAKEEGRVI